jgi:two-component system phosphate regulon sensor histidine kinase PhoR
MKNSYIKIITCVALASILVLQGMWLYNTYTLLEIELKKNTKTLFATLVHKEAVDRMNDPIKKGTWKHKIIDGYMIENDIYTNIIALQNYLYLEEYPLSMQNLDSILSEQLNEKLDIKFYSLTLTDSSGICKTIVNKRDIGNSSFKEKIQLRTIDPEFIELSISFPYKIIFRQMLLLLFSSLGLAIIVVYCLFLQIKIIVRQGRIAEIRQDFTHAMIHEMKNPITTILMGINILKGGKLDDKPQTKANHYEIISKEGEHLLSIANKILIIAQFEEKKIDLSKKTIDLAELIRNLTEKYQLNPSKKIHFQIVLNEVKNIYGDYEYLYESFNNIIDNAVKYSKEEVNISITSSIKENDVQIKFKDNGIGISLKDQKKIFEKFERASAVQKNRETSGFGLGLNYVYQVVSAHDGKIELDSVLGLYSEFTINLPNNDKVTTD